MSWNNDNWNYANDARVRNAGKNTPPVVYDEDGNEVDLPTKYIVCPTCQGVGKHVNPSIDAGGLTADDFNDDPDFAESYMRGDYDEDCYQCNGRTTVLGVDYDALTPAQTRALEAQLQSDAEDRAEELWEIRHGC